MPSSSHPFAHTYIASLSTCNIPNRFPSFEVYLKFMQQYGAVIEAEQAQVLGQVDGLCFIAPNGDISVAASGGVDIIQNERGQEIGNMFPQYSTSAKALEGATLAVATTLFKNYDAIGYVTISFVSFWDPYDSMPKLWAEKISFGMTPIFGALGTFSILNSYDMGLPNPHFPKMVSSEMKHMVFLPFCYHSPLRESRDDFFFKLCKLHAIGFDVEACSGALFPLIDTIISGTICLLCCHKTRLKVLEVTNQTIQFMLHQFGKDRDVTDHLVSWENLTLISKQLRLTARHEQKTASADHGRPAGNLKAN